MTKHSLDIDFILSSVDVSLNQEKHVVRIPIYEPYQIENKTCGCTYKKTIPVEPTFEHKKTVHVKL